MKHNHKNSIERAMDSSLQFNATLKIKKGWLKDLKRKIKNPFKKTNEKF